MIKTFQDKKSIFWFPTKWANSVARWIMGLMSKTGTIKIANNMDPGDSGSCSIDVDVEVLYNAMKDRLLQDFVAKTGVEEATVDGGAEASGSGDDETATQEDIEGVVYKGALASIVDGTTLTVDANGKLTVASGSSSSSGTNELEGMPILLPATDSDGKISGFLVFSYATLKTAATSAGMTLGELIASCYGSTNDITPITTISGATAVQISGTGSSSGTETYGALPVWVEKESDGYNYEKLSGTGNATKIRFGTAAQLTNYKAQFTSENSYMVMVSDVAAYGTTALDLAAIEKYGVIPLFNSSGVLAKLQFGSASTLSAAITSLATTNPFNYTYNDDREVETQTGCPYNA